MKSPKPKKQKTDPEMADDVLDDGRPVRFEALEELTQSDVIAEVKAGMSRVLPDESNEDDGFQEDVAA